MAITRAQQVRQMLEDGGMLVKPSTDGKRPGYRSAKAQENRSKGPSKSSSKSSNTGYTGGGGGGKDMGLPGQDRPSFQPPGFNIEDQKFKTPDGRDESSTYDPDAALAAAIAQGKFDKKNPIENFINTYTGGTRRTLYNIFPNNPRNELDYLRSLPASQRALLSPALKAKLEALELDEDQDLLDTANTKFTFDEFEELRKFQPTEGLNFAEYAAKYKGAPGLLYSGDVGNLEKFVSGVDKFGNKIYDYRERRDDDGGGGGISDYERRLLELEQQLKDQQAAAPTTNPFAFRFLADGGRAAFRIGSDSGKDTSGRDYASDTAASRSVATSPSRDTGGGRDDNNNQPPQKINVPKPIKDAGNTAGELMFLKNVFELNPVGIMKNIGTKMFLDKLISEADTQQNQNMMLAFEPGSIKDKQLKQMYNIFQETGMQDPRMKGLMKEDIEQGGPLSLPKEAYQMAADGGRIGAMGGGIMDADMIGGMMDGNMDEMGRQMYGLGKLVKKAVRGVKKIAKSPIGKVALLAGLNFAPTLFGKQTVLQGLGGMFSKKGLSDFFLKKAGEGFSLGNLSSKGLMTGIAGLSALPLIFQGDDEEEFDPYRGPDIDIDKIRSDPYGAMRGAYRLAADGGLMRAGYQEGGDAEPVAKKTMPLIDMDGKEKDYRETGGFVDMGRMERADDVPARLSKNEFVFTADAVRNAGEGDIDKGAEVMYNMMKNLEAGGEVSEESQGLEGARKMFQTSQRLGEVI